MNGNNTSFTADPVTFLGTNPVNVSSIVKQTTVGKTSKGAAPEPPIAKYKYGIFDISTDGAQTWLKEIGPTEGFGSGDSPLMAYWCPFVQGTGAAGFVDVPKVKPVTNFVFTAAMNGCSLMVTAAPKATDFRVYHHQHPTDPGDRATIMQASGFGEGDIVFEWGVTDYDNPPTTGYFFQVFNFLLFNETTSTWKLYSQYTKLLITSGVNKDKQAYAISTSSLIPSKPLLVADVPMP